jgi:hypothetical protein
MSVAGSISGSKDSFGTQRLGVDPQGDAVVTGSVFSNTTYTFGAQSLTLSGLDRNYVTRFGANKQWQWTGLAPVRLATTTDGVTSIGQYGIEDIALDATANLFTTGRLCGAATSATVSPTASSTAKHHFRQPGV